MKDQASALPAAAGAPYALLSDGTTVLIRPATAGDFDAVRAMHAAMSPENSYLRFFSIDKMAPEREARRICRAPGQDHAALLAVYAGSVVGVASYEVAEGTDTAEVAFAVADTMHHRGIATLLLEHLVSLARASQLTAFRADTLDENTSMLQVVHDAGLPAHSEREDGTVTITIPLPPGGRSGLAGRSVGAGWEVGRGRLVGGARSGKHRRHRRRARQLPGRGRGA